MSVMVAAGATRPLATGARCDGESEIDMDLNENLRRQRQILAELREIGQRKERAEEQGYGTDEEEEQERVSLADLSALAEEMDEELSGGDTALPDAWRHLPDVAARRVDHQTTAVTIAGVDVYVRDAGNAVVVSVGADELPAHKSAYVESFDGVSWERELP